jgi:hypothetical protein
MICAYITDDLYSFGVRISVVQQHEGRPHSILRVDDDPGRFRWEPIEDPRAEVKATMTLQNEEARALLDSLTRFFHGAEDTRALRRDYEAERGRVDLLVGSLSMVTQTLADRATEARDER